MLVLFPDGRLSTRLSRWPMRVYLATSTLWPAGQVAGGINAIAGHQIHVNASASVTKQPGRAGRNPLSRFDILGSVTTEQPWPWPEAMDALLAAPGSHRVLLENDRVRVLEVVIEPRTREPEHTHRAVSVMIVDEPSRIRYYAGDTLRYESQGRDGSSPPGERVSWMEPEGPHSVENIDECRYHAIRVELK